jgi:WD40-like Beta Propeller Repeat
MRRVWLVLVLGVLVALVPLPGCSHRGRPESSQIRVLAVSPETGYDPAWSPDRAQIAFVRAPYRRTQRYGLLPDNDVGIPTGRDRIALWDVRGDRLRTLSPAISKGKTILSVVWQDGSHLVYLAVDPGSVDAEHRAKLLWNTTFAYRGATQSKDAVILDTATMQTKVAIRNAPLMYVEASSSEPGKVAVWRYTSGGHEGDTHTWSAEWVDDSGKVRGRLGLPDGTWSAPAVASIRGSGFVAVRREDEGLYSLVGIARGHTRDLYSPGTMVNGAYGSPDRRAVAFLEAIPGIAPGVRMNLKVMPWAGGETATVARDASPMSQVTWSPNGTKIAYCRADDGRIAVALVPRVR